MLTIQLQKIPTRAPNSPRHAYNVLARCPTTGEVKGRWEWWNSQRPDRRNTTVMLNCYRWKAEWLPDQH